jgi:serine/threonine protein kinase
MGVVFRARQTSLDREVALKLVRPELLYFRGSRGRFRREVEAIAQLQHSGIIAIHTVGEESGLPYFAMELLG